MKFKLQIFKPKAKKNENDACLNCRQPFIGYEKFCSYCGQKNTSKKLSLGVFVNNMFSGFLSYDSRFWTTFIPLLSKPGEVSKEYIEGKRARFVNPFQLYLNVSIIFFLILGISNRIDNPPIQVNKTENENQTIDSLNQRQKDSIINSVQKEIILEYPNDSTASKFLDNIGDVFTDTTFEHDSLVKNEKPYQYHIKTDTTSKISLWKKYDDFYHYHTKNPKADTNQLLDSLGYKKTFWNRFYCQQVINSNRNIEQIKENGLKQFKNKMFSYLSISLFVFLPIFTFFLMLIYIRRNFSYMEHLVFVFNTQTVFFLLLTIFFLLDFVVDLENFGWIFIVLFAIYLYMAMLNFYEQSKRKTFVKYIILNCIYLFLGLFGGVLVALITFTGS